jgi:apolipoprotein N-acyltransferase
MQLDPKIAKLAGLGGFAVAFGVVVVYAGFLWLMHPVPYGGPNPTTFAVAAIAVGALCAALIAAHIVIGKELLSRSD